MTTPRDYRLKYQRSCQPPTKKRSFFGGGLVFPKIIRGNCSMIIILFLRQIIRMKTCLSQKIIVIAPKENFLGRYEKKVATIFSTFLDKIHPSPQKIHIIAFLQGFKLFCNVLGEF